MTSRMPSGQPPKRGVTDPHPDRPAGRGHPPIGHPYRLPIPEQPEPALARTAGGVTFLAGVWLAIAPFALDYVRPGEGFEGYWHEIVVGAVIGMLALVRSAASRHVPWLSVTTLALGVWLVFAPSVLGYDAWPASTTATVNNVVVGTVVVLTAALTAASTYQRRQDVEDDN